jgi:hypothetical protein
MSECSFLCVFTNTNIHLYIQLYNWTEHCCIWPTVNTPIRLSFSFQGHPCCVALQLFLVPLAWNDYSLKFWTCGVFTLTEKSSSRTIFCSNRASSTQAASAVYVMYKLLLY